MPGEPSFSQPKKHWQSTNNEKLDRAMKAPIDINKIREKGY